MALKGLWKKEIYAGKFKFGIGLLVMAVCGVAIPALYGTLLRLVETVPIPRGFEGQLNMLKDYEIYIWSQWFGKNYFQLATGLAVVFGAGLISSEIMPKTVQFLLAKPISRQNVFMIKYTVNLITLGLVMTVSTLVLYIAVLATGHSYPVENLVNFTVMALAGAAVVFSVAVYYSTVFDQTLKSVVMSFVTALVLAVPGMFPALKRLSVYYHMSGASLMAEGKFPWAALAVMVLVSAGLYVLGSRRFARMDF